MKRFYALIGLCLIVMFTAKAQVVTTDPAFPTDGAAVTIVFDATLGTAGLKGFTGDVYAHTGVITDQSKDGSDWRYASDWNVNLAKYKMTSLGNNKWEDNSGYPQLLWGSGQREDSENGFCFQEFRW